MKWQPIETAPKDIAVILYEDGESYVAEWDRRFDRWRMPIAPRVYFKPDPSHWMPLPEPPDA